MEHAAQGSLWEALQLQRFHGAAPNPALKSSSSSRSFKRGGTGSSSSRFVGTVAASEQQQQQQQQQARILKRGGSVGDHRVSGCVSEQQASGVVWDAWAVLESLKEVVAATQVNA
jgi:hypothetical protein